MSKVCEKHREHPVKIYDQCVGCEIESLRSEISRLKRGGWISVRERLPKIGDNVLVFYRRANEYGVDIMRFVGRWVKVDPLIEVTHWQPLPEPPKEE